MTPQPITCEQCRELLSGYVDRELDAGEQAAVEHHLATCVRCGNESSRLVGLKNIVQHWDGVKSSEKFREAVLEKFVSESRMMPSAPFTEAAEKARADSVQGLTAQQGGRKKLSLGWCIAIAIVLAALGCLLYWWLPTLVPS